MNLPARKGIGLKAVVTAWALAIAAITPLSRADAAPALFGTSETRSSNINLFPKWKGTLARYFDERGLPDAPCESTRLNRCHLAQWGEFLKDLRGRSPMDQIVAVNTRMNRKRYILDPKNYGVSDYWATPRQFLARHGDCEDYAIAKYMSLRSLGFDASRLRIVVLKDMNLGLAHAILVVYDAGRAYVLDNQIKTVVPADRVYHYKPYYSINENHWWLHRTRLAGRRR